MLIRERLESAEQANLSAFAALSVNSAGRRQPEPPCPVRTCYQRDRDRIIHLCRAFRRLAHKTQVFISPREDHLRTRLSHTLEVAQIARTVAKALCLNEDLTEAIALAHDVGHTPYGHSGEAALDRAYRRYDPQACFSHQLHSLRVVEELERDGTGLNLTRETLQGITEHSKGEANLADVLAAGPSSSLEALVVSVSDRIAYLNHDLDDCLRAGLLTPDELPIEVASVLGSSHSARVGTMVTDLIEYSVNLNQPGLQMSPRVLEATDALKREMFESIYLRAELLEDAQKVNGIIGGLFDVYMANDAALRDACDRVPTGHTQRARLVCDYIAGMTDRFATHQYSRHFLPSSFPY